MPTATAPFCWPLRARAAPGTCCGGDSAQVGLPGCKPHRASAQVGVGFGGLAGASTWEMLPGRKGDWPRWVSGPLGDVAARAVQRRRGASGTVVVPGAVAAWHCLAGSSWVHAAGQDLGGAEQSSSRLHQLPTMLNSHCTCVACPDMSHIHHPALLLCSRSLCAPWYPTGTAPT